VVSPNLEDQNYLSVLTSAKKKIKIAKYLTLLKSTIPKTSWDERIYHLCDTKRVEDEKHFFLELPCLFPN
jgi:hypothetical protein